MNVVLVTDDYPPAVGGIASYLRDLYGGGAGDVEARVIVGGLGAVSPLVRAILRKRPAVLFAGTLFSSGVVAAFVSRLFAIPYALHVYGTDLTTRSRSRLMQHVAGWVLRGASRVVVISDFGAGCAAEWGIDPTRIVKVVPPVDTHRFRPAPSGGTKLLLTVARLVPRKGHDVVLRALPHVLSEVPEARYVIVGDGPDRVRLESIVQELGLGAAVRFEGQVDDVVPWYQACDVFVMMSRDAEGEVEGFGIAFTEASACGKPVVGGRVGGTPEAVIDGVTGILVDPVDHRAVAKAIVHLLTHPEAAAQMGRAGRARAERELSLSAAVRRLGEIVEEMTR
jgi:phosphatidylinositol alpha-1,6-mannosyltransferase